MSETLFELRDVSKRFRRGDSAIHAVDSIDLTIAAGELVAIEGPSGSGKTTLLQLLGALDRPDEGQVFFEGRELQTLGDRALAELRLRAFGFVFQQFNLIPTLSALENVEAALAPSGLHGSSLSIRATNLLDEVGLADRMTHLPSHLSGGEQQRVAIARALVHDPRIFLADEPTGNLDPATSWEIIQLLLQINARGTTVLMATHNREIVDVMRRRVVAIDGGQIIRDEDAGGYHAPALESH